MSIYVGETALPLSSKRVGLDTMLQTKTKRKTVRHRVSLSKGTMLAVFTDNKHVECHSKHYKQAHALFSTGRQAKSPTYFAAYGAAMRTDETYWLLISALRRTVPPGKPPQPMSRGRLPSAPLYSTPQPTWRKASTSGPMGRSFIRWLPVK